MSGDYELPSGIVIPGETRSIKGVFNRFYCTVCKEGFTADEAEKYQRHVVDCAKKNEDELRKLSMREVAPGIFGDEGWDTEFEKWVRDNSEAILEDRLRV